MAQIVSKLIKCNFDMQNIAVAYYSADSQKIEKSYGDLFLDINRAAGQFRGFKGKIGILAKNNYEYLVNFLAILKAGCAVVLLNVDSTLAELEHEIQMAELEKIVYDGEYGKNEPSFREKYSDFLLDSTSFYNLIEEDREIKEFNDDDLAVLLFTSGTTGRSKGVMLSMRSIEVMVDTSLDYTNYFIIDREDETMFATFPFYHIGGICDGLSWLFTGKKLVINLDKRFFFRDLVDFGCTYTSLVPSNLQTIYKYVKRGKLDYLGKLNKIVVSAAKCEPSMFSFFRDNGFSLYQLYGLSENCGFGLYNFTGTKDDSLGVVQKNCQCAIIDGEICLKSDMMMLGYCKNIEATNEVIYDGWLHTGDLGRIDDEGFVYLTGRKKNLIILASGENISPEELESMVLENELVKEVIVKEKGNKICAEIYCDDEYRDQVNDFIQKINQTVPYFKRITLVEFFDEPFAKTSSGKIKRN